MKPTKRYSIRFNNELPNQRISEKAKAKEEFYIPTANFIINTCLSYGNNKDEIKRLYNAANGTLDYNDYLYVTNPFHSENKKLKEFPARLRNIDIISPILLRYVGEYIKSSFKPIVGINNSDSESIRKKEEFKVVKEVLDKLIKHTVDKFNGEEQEEEVPSLSEALEKFNTNWNDTRAIKGQEALNYINNRFDLEYKYIGAYIDWLISGQFYDYKDVRFNDLYFDVVSPLEIYAPSNNSEWVDEYDMVTRKYKMSVHDIVNQFRDILDLKDIQYIEDLINNYCTSNKPINVRDAIISTYVGETYEYLKEAVGETSSMVQNSMIDVYHYVYLSYKKIYILRYQNAMGKILTMEVDENYKLDVLKGDIDIKVDWINEYREGYRFGDEQLGVYTKTVPLKVQQNEINNTSIVKNCYGGKRFMYKNFINHSIVNILTPYQVVYNIIHYYREQAIANNIGKILVIPKGLLVNDDEITQEETIYYIKADKKLYVDETADNFPIAIQGLKTVDASDADYILALGRILQEIKQEAWDTVGMNRQRYGDTYASDGKGTTEQAIYRASIGSAPITEIFNKARLRSYMSLLNYSKIAWLNDDESEITIGSYLNDEGRVAYLNMNPVEHSENDYGIFIVNQTQLQDKIDAYKQLAFSAAQNGAFELGVASIEFDNPSKLKRIIKEWREIEDKRNAQQQQVQQQQQQETLKQAMQVEQMKLDNNIAVAKIKADATIAAANIKADNDEQGNQVKREVAEIKANTDIEKQHKVSEDIRHTNQTNLTRDVIKENLKQRVKNN